MPTKDYSKPERRQYIRLDSVFPVQFCILSPDGKSQLSDWLQGFTNDISRGGICLSVNNLNPRLGELVKNKQAKLSLGIEIPLSSKPVSALAKVVWVEEIASQPNKYLLGLNYEEIIPAENKRIIHYARAKKIFAPLVLSIVIVLGIAFIIGSYINVKLIKGNKALVEQLVKIVQESSVAKQIVKEISKEREDLQVKIQTLQLRIKTVEEDRARLNEKSAMLEANTAKRTEELSSIIDKLNLEKAGVQEQLISLQRKESAVTEELLRLDKRKVNLEKANLDKMYQWLKIHQNPHTGLVMSFEGDSDITNWGFIYDQSLVMQAYINFSDFERVKKMLTFFDRKAKRMGSGFLNAYYVNDGTPAEYVVHSGPNIWLGIAIVQYTYKTNDKTYLKLAQEIAQYIITLQDAEGGIRGGPEVEWYSTEHNLDAYAFFNMIYKVTNKPLYAEVRDKILNWLTKHTYAKTDIPIKRGKGDSTIATDTYAWSIAAIGPEKLAEVGMNPDRILEFAEQNCSIDVSYARQEGQSIKIKGFDFAAKTNLARGGIISSEWTAQMVIAFKIMADFYYKKGMIAKARAYLLKADEYLSELSNMIISSPSPSGQGESCLPYATQEFVDTGHGWMTPKGKSTGSVAGTVYTMFAYYNYNPLELKE